MESPSTFRLDKGFTLLETLVVTGIFIVLMGVGGVIGFNAYKGYLFRSERSTAVSVLERARSRAMANYFESKHGVKYDAATHEYILFRGNSYVSGASENEIIKGNPNSEVTWTNPVIFEQLTGNVAISGAAGDCEAGEEEILIKESDKTSSVCINSQGRINW